MAIDLPTPIAAYFAADKGRDAQAVSRCFTEDAVVMDEGHTFVGRDTIRRWMAESSAKYTYTAEPIALESAGERTVVTAHLTGNFPGSPVNLRYFFHLDGEAIAALEIIP